MVDGTDVTEAIRSPEVSRAVSVVAANPEVRAVLVQRQRAWVGRARRGGRRGPRHRLGGLPGGRRQDLPDRRRPRSGPAGGREEGADARGPAGPARLHPGGIPAGGGRRRPVIDTTGPAGARISWRRCCRGCDRRRRGRSRRRATGRRGSKSRSTPRSPPIYRFLRVLVHGLNRLLFRPTVDGCRPGSRRGPVIIAPVHRSFIDFFVASEVTEPQAPLHGQGQLWKNKLLGQDPPARRRLPGPPRVGRPRGAAAGPGGARRRRGADPLPRGDAGTRAGDRGPARGGGLPGRPDRGPDRAVGIGGSASVMPKGTRHPQAAAHPRDRGPAHPAPGPHRWRAGSRAAGPASSPRTWSALQDLYDRSVAATGATEQPAAVRRRPARGGSAAGAVAPVTRHQVVTMTRAYRKPKKLPPFFVVPEARGSHTRRPLGDPPAAAGRGDQQLGRLVLGLDQAGHDVVEQLDPQGPVAVRRVGQLLGRRWSSGRRRRP